MAINFGQTSLIHKDRDVQVEFERVAKAFGRADKDLAVLEDIIRPISDSLSKGLWDLMVSHNGTEVQPKTMEINFLDSEQYKFKVQKWDKNEVRVSVEKSETADINNYNTLWESLEDNDYVIDSGSLETIDTKSAGDRFGYSSVPPDYDYIDIVNRQPQYFGRPYPQTNNGDGWIPMRYSTEVHEDTLDYVNVSTNRKYSENAGTFEKDVFFFCPTESGVYKFDIQVYLKARFCNDTAAIQYKVYDTIEKGMLIAEKCTNAQIFDEPPTYEWHNPIEYNDTGSPNENQLYLIDERGNFGEQEPGFDYSALTGYGAVTTLYPNTDTGCNNGLFYKPDINLNGSLEIYCEEGDCIMFWYKIYGHRVKDGGSGYVRVVPYIYGGSQIVDDAMLIEKRYERIAITFLGNKENNLEENRVNIREIVKLF